MAAADRILVGFKWEGPTRCDGSPPLVDITIVNRVRLVFTDAKSQFSVHLPANPSGPLTFTCRRYHDTPVNFFGKQYKVLDRETHPEELSMSPDRVRNLKLNIGADLENDDSALTIKENSETIASTETTLKTGRMCKPTVPDILEIGKKYTLVVTSDGHRVGARFVKVGLETEPAANFQLQKDRAELAEFLKKNGNLGLDGPILCFEVKWVTDHRVGVLFPGGILKLVDEIVTTIDKDRLRELLVKIRESKAEGACQPNAVLSQCLNTIGIETISATLEKTLKGLVHGPIAPDIQQSIQMFVEPFKSFLNDLWR